MKFSVKIIIKSTVESGEVSLEESILMMDADSFDDAYDKAERYVEERGICDAYRNYEGKQVTREIVSYADCFAPFEDDEDDSLPSIVVSTFHGTYGNVTSVGCDCEEFEEPYDGE